MSQQTWITLNKPPATRGVTMWWFLSLPQNRGRQRHMWTLVLPMTTGWVTSKSIFLSTGCCSFAGVSSSFRFLGLDKEKVICWTSAANHLKLFYDFIKYGDILLPSDALSGSIHMKEKNVTSGIVSVLTKRRVKDLSNLGGTFRQLISVALLTKQ